MPDDLQRTITDFYKNEQLAPGKVNGTSVIYHTVTRKYINGTLELDRVIIQQFREATILDLEDYSDIHEYKQQVLEMFEDTMNALEADGYMVDYDADHL